MPFSLLRERTSGNNGHSDGDENVLSLARPSERDQGSIALNLVYRAAEVFGGIEDRDGSSRAVVVQKCYRKAEVR